MVSDFCGNLCKNNCVHFWHEILKLFASLLSSNTNVFIKIGIHSANYSWITFSLSIDFGTWSLRKCDCSLNFIDAELAHADTSWVVSLDKRCKTVANVNSSETSTWEYTITHSSSESLGRDAANTADSKESETSFP
jgi:hypothetical protein